ncbi:hypothetical protein K1T71_001019 [Dendrolimus kikuchii]|uniref:Uncharacterized protein n=1 Tax=Dendrolimus kikuchii TaxID=765133 RepID=A0ACC1DHB1_9NEOP|nr:hypothetical protein K1T71_001019 [Dendrolimus kikuchii]
MKGQSKRFVNHKGQQYEVEIQRKLKENIGFFDLWRYATVPERLATILGVLLSWVCSMAVICAVMLYGELTGLFVQRYKADATAARTPLLGAMGGGEPLPAGNATVHMDALVDDSIAFALVSVVIIFVTLVMASTAVTLANWAAARMVTRLRLRLLRSVLCQEIAFFDTNTSMNFASTLTEDMDKLRAGVGEHVVMTSYLAGTVVCGCALALSYGWQLTLSGMSIVPVAIVIAGVVSKYQTKCSEKEVTAYGSAGRIVEEALSAIRTVRAYGGEELEVQRYTEALIPAAKEARKRGLWAGVGSGLGWLLTYSLNAIVFAYGAILIIRDQKLPADDRQYDLGVMVTILFCTFISAQNIAMCHPHLEIFSRARGAAKSLFKLLERKSNINGMEDKGIKPEQFRGDIEFNNLYFNYPSRPDVKVLRGLNLNVKAGETVALVGGSGCGKSTLLQLLQRMYEPDSGSITVDGQLLNNLNLHHFRTSIGVVGQEPVLFSGTIRDNITIGLDNVTEETLVAAAKTAHAHQFITKLASGYDTMLGERGAQLSGGQKQRIAIARAVLRKPAVLLLDEPTSALDPAAERQVQAALDAASKGRTTLVVSHRLSTIVNASRIVYMEHGAVLEQGTHLELLEKKGLYWKLVHEDMTSKSIATALSTTEEDDDLVENNAEHFRRSFNRSSITPQRESISRDSVWRRSRRLGSISSAHVPTTVADLTYVEVEESSEEEASPPASTMALLKLNRREWPLLAWGGLASFLVGATMPIFAVLFSKLYGMFSSSNSDEILSKSQLYAGLFAGVAAVCGLVNFAQTWLFNLAGCRLTDRLREVTFRNFLKQEQGWFDEQANSVGALCARLATDCAAVQGATGTCLGTVLQGMSTMLLGVGVAMAFSWKMTLVSLLSVPFVIGGIYLEGYITKRSEVKQKRALEQASRIATEAVLNVRTVQSLGIEKSIISRYEISLQEASRNAAPASRVRGPVYGLCLCAPTLGYTVSLAYGGYLIAREGMHYEYAILVSEALIYGAWMLAEALSFAPNFAAARRSGARIIQALEREPKIKSEKTAKDDDWSASGQVNFSNIHFRYPTRPTIPVLKGLNLKLETGKTLALVGASGCGKSTLMHLLMRSYDPERGDVELDSKNIVRDLSLGRLRAQLGLVQQEPALFERSIHVSMNEIIEAAKQANVHNFVSGLPLGYETRLGQGGAALSGGQKQRVAIARALVRNPRVLLLDEATSALDASSEKTVQAALEEAAKERTTIIIAHRLATVRHAHTICVIDKGVVAESGSHEELVHRRGLYWELLQQQAPAEANA